MEHKEQKEPRAIKKKKEDLLNTRIGKYYKNKKLGITKKEAAIRAGFPDGNHVTQIERSVTYRELTHLFKDEMLEQSTMGELAGELLKVIRQDNELGPKVSAIKLAIERIEPELAPKEVEDKVTVILR